MLRRFSNLLWAISIVPFLGCNFGLVQMNIQIDSSSPLDTAPVVDSGGGDQPEESTLVGAWTLSEFTWTVGPSGDCVFESSGGTAPQEWDCNYSVAGNKISIDSSRCPGLGTYTFELLGTDRLSFTQPADPSCPDRQTLLTGGLWNRLW